MKWQGMKLVTTCTAFCAPVQVWMHQDLTTEVACCVQAGVVFFLERRDPCRNRNGKGLSQYAVILTAEGLIRALLEAPGLSAKLLKAYLIF